MYFRKLTALGFAAAMMAVALTSMAPTASAACQRLAPQGAATVNLGVGETCDWDDGCAGFNVMIRAPGSCSDHDGKGCQGITILVYSPDSCVGSAGEAGCQGTQIIDPASEGSCRGGNGEPPRLKIVRR